MTPLRLARGLRRQRVWPCLLGGLSFQERKWRPPPFLLPALGSDGSVPVDPGAEPERWVIRSWGAGVTQYGPHLRACPAQHWPMPFSHPGVPAALGVAGPGPFCSRWVYRGPLFTVTGHSSGPHPYPRSSALWLLRVPGEASGKWPLQAGSRAPPAGKEQKRIQQKA